MSHIYRYISILLFLLFSSSLLIGQEAITDSTNTSLFLQLGDTTYSINDSLQVIKIDSVKPTKEVITENIVKHDSGYVERDSAKYSLNDFLFRINDTILVEKWVYNTDIHNFNFMPYDSTLKEFHIYHPAFKNSINNNYLGQIGLAVKSNIFFEANPETGFLFLNSFTPYMHQANSATYYNVKEPFTFFQYQAGPKDEQNIALVHTQNISRYFNAFFKFNNYSGEGVYLDQETKNNSGALGGAYTRGRFSTYLNYTFSRINVEENGGIVDPYYITDTAVSPSEISTRLNDGTNYMKDRQWFFDQKIGLVRVRQADTCKNGDYLFSIQYNYQNQHSIRIYEDDDETYTNNVTGETLYMYDHHYNGGATYDTSSFSHNVHLLRLNLEESIANPLSFGAYVGIGKESNRYFYENKDTLFVYDNDTTCKSTYAEAGIFRLNPANNIRFFGHYTYFLKGYRKNDFTLRGFLDLRFGRNLWESEFIAEGSTESKTADYLLTKYYSNHFRWKNNFDKENLTQLKLKYALPALSSEIGVRYALLTNYIYFDSLGLPAQFTSDFNVFDAYLKSIIEVKGIGLINKVCYQQSGKQSVLPLPEWSFYNALYYYHNIHFDQTDGNMKVQLGVDFQYWSAFYAEAYSPATAQFHLQTSQTTGDYPFFGAFLNLEIKRMRIFIKVDHLNYSYMKKRDESNYFMSPGYPTPKLVTRYGLAWTFYN